MKDALIYILIGIVCMQFFARDHQGHPKTVKGWEWAFGALIWPVSWWYSRSGC